MRAKSDVGKMEEILLRYKITSSYILLILANAEVPSANSLARYIRML